MTRLTLDEVSRMPEHIQRQVGEQLKAPIGAHVRDGGRGIAPSSREKPSEMLSFQHLIPELPPEYRATRGASDGTRRRATGAVQVPYRSKYGNHKCEQDGIKFDSKRERDYYLTLKHREAHGEIKGFARQVSLPLAFSKRRIRLDFMVHENDDTFRWIDAKGHPDPAWMVKRDLIESQLKIRIELV